MCETSCVLMSPLAGNCSDRPICEQGYVSPEGCMCMYKRVCACVKERNDKTWRGVPPTWPLCCRGDKQSKQDVLAEAGPIVHGLKKAYLIG